MLFFKPHNIFAKKDAITENFYNTAVLMGLEGIVGNDSKNSLNCQVIV